MRPLLAILISFLIFAAVGSYLRLAEALRVAQAKLASPEDVEVVVEDEFDLEITLTFDAGADNAFALAPTQSAAVLVRFRNREVLRIDEPVPAGTPLRVEGIGGVVEGANELYVEAHPAAQGLPVAHAARVRVFRNGVPIAEKTLWSEPGLPVTGTIRIDVGAASDDHEH
ncbi:MAG: hypothetical protein KY475_16480 [Planctomycetes bacterium]|nr:hypothetical protein [Planctomycetota bacterium]